MSDERPGPATTGPFEDLEWAERLVARVVRPGPRPAIHGFDVHEDLARAYSFAELGLLALTGEPPDTGAGRAFEVACAFASPCSIAEAPAHAAMLVRLCGARPAGVISTACAALAEQARAEVAEHAELLAWLEGGGASPFPESARARDEADRAAVGRFVRALPEDGPRPAALAHDPSLLAAILSVFHAVGLRTAARLEAALVSARLLVVTAEALAAAPGDFRGYPSNLPPFAYEEP